MGRFSFEMMPLHPLYYGDGRASFPDDPGRVERGHRLAESLFTAAQTAGEQVSLATVYNTLRAFCAAGLLTEITVDGTRSYFDTRQDDHPHFYWEDSQALTDAPGETLRLVGLPPAPAGTAVARVDVVIRLRRA